MFMKGQSVITKIPINMLSDLYGAPGVRKVGSFPRGTLLKLGEPHPQGGGRIFFATVMKTPSEPDPEHVGVVRVEWIQPGPPEVSAPAPAQPLAPPTQEDVYAWVAQYGKKDWAPMSQAPKNPYLAGEAARWSGVADALAADPNPYSALPERTAFEKKMKLEGFKQGFSPIWASQISDRPIGYSRSASGVTHYFDLEGTLVGMSEIPIEADALSPVDFIPFEALGSLVMSSTRAIGGRLLATLGKYLFKTAATETGEVAAGVGAKLLVAGARGAGAEGAGAVGEEASGVGRGLFGKQSPVPTGPVSAELRQLYLQQLESRWFQLKLKAYARLTGKGEVAWGELAQLLKSAEFREYASLSQMAQSVGYAGMKDGKLILGMSKIIRKVPIIGNSAMQHEIVHVFQELSVSLISREAEKGSLPYFEVLSVELAANVFGSPAWILTASGGVVLLVTLTTVYVIVPGVEKLME